MRKISAAIAAVMLTSGLALVASSPAVAAEAEADVCYVDETHTELVWELQRSDWVAPTAATIEAGWYTEPDDNGPVASDTGLTFTADGVKATGLRKAVSIPLADVTGPSFPGTDYFHERLVIDVVGEPFTGGQAWRNDYLSLNFTLAGVYVNTPASGWQTLTLDEVKALFEGATVTSIGFHLDSNSPAGTVATVDGHVVPGTPEHYTDWYVVSEGQGVELPDGREDGEEFQTDALYRYVVTGDIDVIEKVVVDCPPVTEEPKPTPEPTKTPVPVVPASNTGQLADTGFDATPMLVMAIIGLIVGAGVLVSTRIVTKRSSSR